MRRSSQQKRKILIVDDNVDASELLASALERAGYTCRAVHDARRAVDEAKAFEPDLVVLDILMPARNGYEIAVDLKRLYKDRPPPPPLVAVTGLSRDSEREASKALGFVAHVVKPVKLPDVVALVGKLLP